jgi:hypothetical protein
MQFWPLEDVAQRIRVEYGEMPGMPSAAPENERARASSYSRVAPASRDERGIIKSTSRVKSSIREGELNPEPAALAWSTRPIWRMSIGSA